MNYFKIILLLILNPEWPLASELALMNIAPKTTSSGNGSPIPASWLKIKFLDKSADYEAFTDIFLKSAKPVVMP